MIVLDDNSMADEVHSDSFPPSSLSANKIEEIISSEPNIDEEYINDVLSDNDSHPSPPKRQRRLKEKKLRFGHLRKKKKNNDEEPEDPDELPLPDQKPIEVVEILSSDEEAKSKVKLKPDRQKRFSQEPCA